MDGAKGWLITFLVIAVFFAGMTWMAVATSDIPPECTPNYVGSKVCSGDGPPVWSGAGDAPERGGP